MDPNAALERLRELAKRIHEADEDLFDLADEMACTFDGLDEWLCRGGVFPKAWFVASTAIDDS